MCVCTSLLSCVMCVDGCKTVSVHGFIKMYVLPLRNTGGGGGEGGGKWMRKKRKVGRVQLYPLKAEFVSKLQ